jgi:hypothetical protein
MDAMDHTHKKENDTSVLNEGITRALSWGALAAFVGAAIGAIVKRRLTPDDSELFLKTFRQMHGPRSTLGVETKLIGYAERIRGAITGGVAAGAVAGAAGFVSGGYKTQTTSDHHDSANRISADGTSCDASVSEWGRFVSLVTQKGDSPGENRIR